MRCIKLIVPTLLFLGCIGAQAQDPQLAGEVNTVYPDIEKLYIDLHQTPELSTLEEKTSAKMAAALRAAGGGAMETSRPWLWHLGAAKAFLCYGAVFRKG